MRAAFIAVVVFGCGFGIPSSMAESNAVAAKDEVVVERIDGLMQEANGLRDRAKAAQLDNRPEDAAKLIAEADKRESLAVSMARLLIKEQTRAGFRQPDQPPQGERE